VVGLSLRLSGSLNPCRGIRWRRFKRPFPLLYLVCAVAAVAGGALHQPTNYDAFSYRIPRVLHWLSEGRWHWIEAFDARKNFSATGFEWLMLPSFAAFRSLRYAFLANAVSFLLLPGLVFSVFSGIGIKKSISSLWMWILPCASCFVTEAGSIGNDFVAVTYLLIALMFGLKARRSGGFFHVILAVLAAALMTGAKASNLPLLLPVAVCLAPVFIKRPAWILTGMPAWLLAIAISFVPLALLNLRHTGDWTGSPDGRFKLENPVAGLLGNGLQIGSASLAPAIFPPADKINRWFDERTKRSPLAALKEDFPELRFTLPQLASEEASGLGLGVTMSLLLALLGTRHFRLQGLPRMGLWICGSFWVALLFYMAKLGNYSAPRLIAPYYAGVVATPLLFFQSGRVFRRKWWCWSSLFLLIPIVPALVLNPARPLLPMNAVVGTLEKRGIHNPILSRMSVVYSTYAERADAHRTVRELLPADSKFIGFAGTADESEYSFWLPLGARDVRDLVPRLPERMPDIHGLDAIVVSDWGCNDRYGMTPSQFAEKLGWTVTGSIPVKTYASGGDAQWTVLLPPNPSGTP